MRSKTDGVNDVVSGATSLLSTDSVAWKLTAPNSIKVVLQTAGGFHVVDFSEGW
ncbi:MAG: hypothetical protein ABI548_06230 [Polyangiaceae bacterium]